ncbi:hypothetical protein JMJ77_0014122 [Colletotrichum scovillei]|uniref:Uncharacterized protein n=1 Tax=Colletotrichum scovillei TaxID=1209932 RepID=A0A9P7R4C5_9PEZI|nr:hypothetical protein JMJ77_0014122 [Colletotrichum scovillei]KAG7065679.1 hypothetical protein JMJ78_0012426 [Colletotrichum scovillei]KAG7068249.1 hypothetical protein JMJ76_0007939 [Colletotrichum scovillei]
MAHPYKGCLRTTGRKLIESRKKTPKGSIITPSKREEEEKTKKSLTVVLPPNSEASLPGRQNRKL